MNADSTKIFKRVLRSLIPDSDFGNNVSKDIKSLHHDKIAAAASYICERRTDMCQKK